MKILLVKCSYLTHIQKSLSFPLGIMYLASSLRTAGHEVRIEDLRLGYGDPTPVRRAIREFRPDVVGLSSITMESPSLHMCAKLVKSEGPAVYVVAGGPHPTSFPLQVLADPNIDSIVLGEGETAMLELTSRGLPPAPEGVRGVWYRKDGEIIRSGSASLVKNLDSIPFPAWDLVDIEEYAQRSGMGDLGHRRYMTMFSSRGCPYRCIYCHNIFGKGFRARSPESVVEEISRLHTEYDIPEIEFIDDIFNFDRSRVFSICELLKKRGLPITYSFPNGLRTDLLDRDMIRTMKEAGLTSVSIAVESASPRIQKLVRKNLNLDKVAEAIEWFDESRIFTRGFFMMGFPTETREEMQMTLRYARSSMLHLALFFIVIPFKGTELYDTYIEFLRKTDPDPKEYDYLETNINLSNVPTGDLHSLIGHAYRSFYLDHRRIVRILRTYPNFLTLLRYIPGAMKYLFYEGWRSKSP